MTVDAERRGCYVGCRL